MPGRRTSPGRGDQQRRRQAVLAGAPRGAAHGGRGPGAWGIRLRGRRARRRGPEPSVPPAALDGRERYNDGGDTGPWWSPPRAEGRMRELERSLGRKTMEAESLRDALAEAGAKKQIRPLPSLTQGRFPMSRLAAVIGVARSNLHGCAAGRWRARSASRKAEDAVPLPVIRRLAGGRPTHGRRRRHRSAIGPSDDGDAPVDRERRASGLDPIERGRLARVVRAHALVPERSTGRREGRVHAGPIALAGPRAGRARAATLGRPPPAARGGDRSGGAPGRRPAGRWRAEPRSCASPDLARAVAPPGLSPPRTGADPPRPRAPEARPRAVRRALPAAGPAGEGPDEADRGRRPGTAPRPARALSLAPAPSRAAPAASRRHDRRPARARPPAPPSRASGNFPRRRPAIPGSSPGPQTPLEASAEPGRDQARCGSGARRARGAARGPRACEAPPTGHPSQADEPDNRQTGLPAPGTRRLARRSQGSRRSPSVHDDDPSRRARSSEPRHRISRCRGRVGSSRVPAPARSRGPSRGSERPLAPRPRPGGGAGGAGGRSTHGPEEVPDSLGMRAPAHADPGAGMDDDHPGDAG